MLNDLMSDIESLITDFVSLQIKPEEKEDSKNKSEPKEDPKSQAAIKIQKWYRGSMCRAKRLPNVMYAMQQFLSEEKIVLPKKSNGGRNNSSHDEVAIIKLLKKRFGKRIEEAKKTNWWYDILVIDYRYGSIPVNIKTTTTTTCDNVGNLSTCLQAYTNIRVATNTSHNNGQTSILLHKALQNRHYNYDCKKDYYFLVINKSNTKEVIVNSILGLKKLTPNINNLPFQICWKDNTKFHYGHITKKVKMFINCLKKPAPSWSETFMANMRSLE